MEEKNQNIEKSNKKDLTQEEIEDVQGGYFIQKGMDVKCTKCGADVQMELPPIVIPAEEGRLQ